MSNNSDCFLRKQYNFTQQFQIEEFEESKFADTKSIFFDNDSKNIGVSVTLFGKGWFGDHHDYVMLYIKNFAVRDNKSILLFTCILNVLDAGGEKKFPRTFGFRFLSRNNDAYSDRYMDRSTILSNSFDYLQVGSLIVIAEGTLEEWYVPNQCLMEQWAPEYYSYKFLVQNNGQCLQVYLPKDSAHAVSLTENSSVFRKMWNTPMQESINKRVLLRTEEIPAFMCMLVFIETTLLIFHKATIFDLYKAADKYIVPRLLQECRGYIRKIPLKTVSDILDFATFYQDPELKNFITETYAWKSGKNAPNSDSDKHLDDFSVCNTLPVNRSLIQTGKDFQQYLRNFWKKFQEVSSFDDSCTDISERTDIDSATSLWIPEENAKHFEVRRDELVFLIEDSVHATYLKQHSKNNQWQNRLFKYLNRELPEFLCMMCFIETRKLILYKTTIFDLYKTAHKYDVHILLEECRNYIKKIPLKTVTDILDFAVYYSDSDLKQSSEFYLEKTKNVNPNLEVGNDLNAYFVCDPGPISSSLIKTKEGFENYLRSLWRKCEQVGNAEDLKNVQITEIETGIEALNFYR